MANTNKTSTKIQMNKCQTNLMITWTIGSALLLIIVWLQIMFTHYGNNGRDAIEWLASAIMPTWSLVVGVWANNAINKDKDIEKVDKGIYRAVLFASIAYLLFILSAFAIQPLIARSPLEVLKDSSLVLALFQGILCAFIGIFYTYRPKEQNVTRK